MEHILSMKEYEEKIAKIKAEAELIKYGSMVFTSEEE